MPDNDKEITWPWIKEALPTFSETKRIYETTQILSKQSQCTLLKMKVENIKLKSFVAELKKKLKKMSQDVKRRKHKYKYLDPAKIACSIDI